MRLRTEADLVRTLEEGTWTMDELYAHAAQHADIARDGGLDPIPTHPGDTRWKRRLRGALQAAKAHGNARRVDRAVWAIGGTRAEPRRMVLLVAGASPREFELRLQRAVDLLGTLETPADLVLCDPPYALSRGRAASSADRIYARNADQVVGGYVDVDPAEYEEFTFGWIEVAHAALRPAGQLCVITGPQQAGIVQYAAEKSGLTWVASPAARREFAIRTTRRFSPAHWVCTIMTRGRLNDPRRVFHTPPDLPKAISGVDYPLDWWPDNGRADRPGLLRYDNSLPLRLVRRIVLALTDPGEHVVDPCVGGGSSAIAALETGRAFTGGDINPQALRFTAARLLSEHAWPAEQHPTLFELAA